MLLLKLVCVSSAVLASLAFPAFVDDPQVRGDDQKYEDAFAAALRAMVEAGRSASATVLADLERPAGSLAATLGPAAAPFLAAKATAGEDDNIRKLAVLTLAELGSSEPANAALQELLSSADPVVQRAAATAVSYMGPQAACVLAKRVLAEASNQELRVQFADLLGAVGDSDVRAWLAKAEREEMDPDVAQAMRRAGVVLEHRLAMQPPNERAAWERDAILYWRAASQVNPGTRSATGGFSQAAQQLIACSGPLSSDFLRYKLRQGEQLAASLICEQKDAQAVPELAERAREKSGVGETSRRALGYIATPEAVRALEAALDAGNDEVVNIGIAHGLARCGDAVSAELLSRLSKDESYSKRSRDAFETDAGHLDRKLKKPDPG